MHPKIERDVTFAANRLRRGAWLHYRLRSKTGFMQNISENSVPLLEIELGMRVTVEGIKQAVRMRDGKSPI